MKRASLSEQAYEQLQSAIVGGRFHPGNPMVETELADLLGVSRTPVREALLRLELEGYLERQSSGRLIVHWHTADEITQLFLVRQMLDGQAARLAAERISDRELEELEDLLAADREALRHHRIDQLAALNDQIHTLILEASRNRTLYEMVLGLRSRVHGLNAFAVGYGHEQRQFVEEHTAMVGHLREGDADAIEVLAHAHVRLARDVLLMGLKGGEVVRHVEGTGP